MSEELKLGDLVEATWTTPKGQTKTIRGEIIGLRPKAVRINYLRTSGYGWSISEPWKPRDQVTKVERRPGEKSASDKMREVATLFREAYIASTEETEHDL